MKSMNRKTLALLACLLIPRIGVAQSVTSNVMVAAALQRLNDDPRLLNGANLTLADEKAASVAIGHFVTQFRATWPALDSGKLSATEFVSKRDQLLVSAHAELKTGMSPTGLLRLEEFIRKDFVHIRVTSQPGVEN
jgi:hypothetical protein